MSVNVWHKSHMMGQDCEKGAYCKMHGVCGLGSGIISVNIDMGCPFDKDEVVWSQECECGVKHESV